MRVPHAPREYETVDRATWIRFVPETEDGVAVTRRKTDDVLATARKELQIQLAVVRDEIGRLAAEEHALTQALPSLEGDSASPQASAAATKVAGSSGTAKRSASRGRPRKRSTTRRRPRGASKSTADRISELQWLLAGGPKSRNDLAAALKVSPARVQQLLAELGSAVSSQPDPEKRRGKLWTLTGGGNGPSAAKPTGRRSSGRTKRTSTRKPAARRKQPAK